MATAFEPTPIIQVSIVPAAPQADATSVSPPAAELTPPPPPEVPAQASIASLEDSSLGDDWKSEYEAQVSEWRARSAEQRTKAEEERKKWEEVRAREEKERNDLAASTFGSGWESLSASGVSIDASSKKAVLSDSQSAVGAEGGKPGEVKLYIYVTSSFTHATTRHGLRSRQVTIPLGLFHLQKLPDTRSQLRGSIPQSTRNGRTFPRN